LTFTVYDIFSEYFNYLIENICFSKKYQESIYDQHYSIYDAIRQHDAEAARNAIMDHLAFVGDELRKQTGGKEKRRTIDEGRGTQPQRKTGEDRAAKAS
jgi:DNA-binding FadR family transcriptional regulator